MVADAKFEVAFDVPPGTVPDEPDWVDLTGRIRSTVPVETSTSQTSGAASLRLDNRDGQLDPLNGSSPYKLVPMRHARITVDIDSTIHPVWRGYVDRWPPVWRFNDAVIDVECVDSRVWLAIAGAADLDLPRQRSDERISAILDAASWPAGLRDIDAGQVTLTALQQEGANLLRSLEDAADAEDGALYVAPDGKVTSRSRHHRLDSTSQLSVGGSDIRVRSAQTDWDGDDLVNVGRVELEDGRAFEFLDQASIDEYGQRQPFVVRDLSLPPYEADALAKLVVHQHAEPSLALPDIALNVVDDTELAQVLALRVGALVTFSHSPPSGAVEIVGHVEAITHRSMPGLWQTKLSLSPYFGGGDWMVWNDDLDSQGGPGWDDDGAKWAP